VGEPVKNFERSELNDSEAFTPKMSRITPPTNIAMPIALFI
jgi:hypothetical protein